MNAWAAAKASDMKRRIAPWAWPLVAIRLFALLVLLLAWRPRWALPTAAAMPVIGGVLAVLG